MSNSDSRGFTRTGSRPITVRVTRTIYDLLVARADAAGAGVGDILRALIEVALRVEAEGSRLTATEARLTDRIAASADAIIGELRRLARTPGGQRTSA